MDIMELLNSTKMQAGYTMGIAPDGRESLVVIVKGTFTIPENGQEAPLSDKQEPLFEADVFSGKPGFSAPIYESDYCPHKLRCDILLNGSAYAPRGKPMAKLPVSLQVGTVSKAFLVVGNRFWKKGLISNGFTSPAPFTCMPISYDTAYGGSDNTHEKPAKHKAFMKNPIGVGFHANFEKQFFNGKPLPNTEDMKNSVTGPNGRYLPMSFGPIGRGWEPRYKYGGTYDQNWLDNVFPFLPADFNEAYYQSAPLDQQCNYLRGGEQVVLKNLTPHGVSQFRLPRVTIPVVFFLKKGEPHKAEAVADTLLLEPDLGRLMITWRASLPLKKNMFEITQVLTGEMSRGWWRARELGKTYYPSLGKLVVEKQRRSNEETE